MLSVGKLIETLKYIEKEYGSDSNVVIQLYEPNSERILLGTYALSVGWLKDGSVVISNKALEENKVC